MSDQGGPNFLMFFTALFDGLGVTTGLWHMSDTWMTHKTQGFLQLPPTVQRHTISKAFDLGSDCEGECLFASPVMSCPMFLCYRYSDAVCYHSHEALLFIPLFSSGRPFKIVCVLGIISPSTVLGKETGRKPAAKATWAEQAWDSSLLQCSAIPDDSVVHVSIFLCTPIYLHSPQHLPLLDFHLFFHLPYLFLSVLTWS